MPSSLTITGQSPACSHEVSMNLASDPRGVAPAQFAGRAAVVTLGCAKNQVDSEVMIGVLRKSGFEIVSDLAEADVAIVNTCGFLQSALKESIECVLDVAEYKTSAKLRKLIVAGCAVERYREELKQSLPEVDIFITLDDVLKVGEAAISEQHAEFAALLQRAGRPYFLYDDTMPRQLSTKQHTAYVKISEGCDRPCTFCIIPKIRGAMRSRSIDSIVREVVSLGAQGVKEVNLIAQDLTSYGKDIQGGDLSALLRALDSTHAVPWIRLLYAYPVGVTEELLRTVVELPSVVDYLDIPLQHVSEALLRTMKRPLGKLSPRALVEFIKEKAPGIRLRTTFIVGFPGEREEDVAELEAFIAQGTFSSVGIFTYSPEPGTPAHDMPDQIPEKERKRRRDRLMRAQQAVVTRQLGELLGTTQEVLIEGTHEDTDLLLAGRARFQAPEVDGTIIINDAKDSSGVPVELTSVPVGQIVHVELSEIAGYDLVGTLRV